MRVVTKLLFAVAIVSVIVLTVIGGIQNNNKNRLQEKRLEQLIADAEKREKEKEKEEEVNAPENVDEYDLGSEDLDIDEVFNREDVISQAKHILGIINDETRLEAIKALPLTEHASNKYFSNSSNIYYGAYTEGVDIEVVFAGLDYESTDNSYSANVISNVTYHGENNTTDSDTISLVIHYLGGKIDSWEF